MPGWTVDCEMNAVHDSSMVVGYITNDSYILSRGKTQINGGRDAQLTDIPFGFKYEGHRPLIAMRMVEEGQISMNTTFLDVFPHKRKKRRIRPLHWRLAFSAGVQSAR